MGWEGRRFSGETRSGGLDQARHRGLLPFPFLLALLCVSCDIGGSGPVAHAGAESELAHLTLELALGEDEDNAPQHQFHMVGHMVVSADGTLWVLDGAGEDPMLRRFDSSGRLLGRVGRVGGGPGEYRNPWWFALLADGRVALRDRAAPARLTLYAPDGTFDTVWHLPGWETRGAGRVSVDTGGVVWVGFVGWRPPAPDRPPLVYQRLRPDGTAMDTLRPPAPPEVVVTSLPGVDIPYQPWGRRSWIPSGGFALYRTDEYRIEMYPRVGPVGMGTDSAGHPTSPALVIRRDLPPVPVPRAERRAARKRMEEQVRARAEEGGSSPRVPKVAEFKPPIKSVAIGEDGRIWVEVSLPSVLEDGEWTEPKAYDVFEPDGQYLGRVPTPTRFYPHWMKGDRVWGVLHGEYGQESVRRYHVRWP